MKDTKTLLWLDDIRNPFKGDWIANFAPDFLNDGEIVWVKTCEDFITWINDNGLPTKVAFDHDLADVAYNESGSVNMKDSSWREMTGFDAAKFVTEYCMDNDVELPLWTVQSSNPVGADNINGLLLSFMRSYK